MSWVKQPAVPGGTKGCLNCSSLRETMAPETLIAVGFGSAIATCDGAYVYGEDDANGTLLSCADIELLAAKDPDHDWQIALFAPLYEAVYQRQGDAHWVLVVRGLGFA